MSTDPQPTAGGPPGNPAAGMSPVAQPAHDTAPGGHDTEPPGADPTSVRAGHEPDKFGVRGILYVPAAVVALLVMVYLAVTWGFSLSMRNDPAADPRADPQVADQNLRPTNERLARISSTDPKPLKDADGRPLADTAVPQPRLEYLKQTENDGPFGDPDWMRSKRATGEGNSPELHNEDLRPENYVDPVSKRKILVEYGWADEARKTARVPIADAMRHVAGKLPVRKGPDGQPVRTPETTEDRPKLSNSGTGGPAPPAYPGTAISTPPVAPPKPGGH